MIKEGHRKRAADIGCFHLLKLAGWTQGFNRGDGTTAMASSANRVGPPCSFLWQFIPASCSDCRGNTSMTPQAAKS
jgi:hypothetical protein